MNLKKITQLIKKGESETLELKKSTAQLHAIFKTICGFLNGTGGIIIVGVTNQGKIIGQNVTDHTRLEIANHIAKIEPTAQIDVTYISMEKDKQIIIFKINAKNHKPYIYDGRPYQRHQSTTSKMSQHKYEQLLIERKQLNHSWEELVATGYPVKNLDEELIWNIVSKSINKKRLPASALKDNTNKLLEKLKLIKNKKLINAAAVLFGKSLFPNYPQCQIKLARFKGLDKSEFLDSDLVYGNIFELLEQGELFAQRHLPVAAKIVPGKFRRVEKALIPFDAFREVLLNALCHRNYSTKGGSISIAIYDNRMEISSHGGLPPGVTIKKIKQGFSQPRNFHIANVLYKSGFIEAWGRGIQEIIKKCKEANIPTPQFEADNLEFKVTFNFPNNNTSKISERSKPYRTNFTAKQSEIFSIIEKARKISFKKIKESLNSSIAERTLRRDLAKLKDMELIDNKGQTRNAVWFIVKKK